MTTASKTAAFDEPILWGKKNGFSVREIAAGLGISEELVSERIGANMPKLAKPVPPPPAPPRHVIDARRATDDLRYRNWLRARTGASHTLKASAALLMIDRQSL